MLGLPLLGLNKVTHIIVITNRLFKNVIFEPITLTITKAVANKLLRYLIRHYGLPKVIVLNKGL